MNIQTILVVDDDAEIREGIRILLTGESYTIIEAENGRQALERLSKEVDLVILDVMMPGFSGLRVCEEIRKSSTVPILFLTARAQESDKLVGLTAGGGRLSDKTVFLFGADCPSQGSFAAVLYLPRQNPDRDSESGQYALRSWSHTQSGE